MYLLLPSTVTVLSVFATYISGATGIGAAPATYVKCTARTPAPKGCAIQGHVSNKYYQRFAAQPVESVEECAAVCAGRIESVALDQNSSDLTEFETLHAYAPYCRSFQVSEDGKTCQLNDFNVNKAVKPAKAGTQAKASQIFYNNNCFQCRRLCGHSYGVQLLDNGDFENGRPAGPWVLSVYGSKGFLGKGHNSRYAWRGNKGFEITQELNMCKGETYVLQFDYQITGGGREDSFFITFGGPNIDYDQLEAPEGSFQYFDNHTPNVSRWKTVRGYFTYLGGIHVGPYFRVGERYTAAVDNVYVARIPGHPALKPSTSPIIQNRGFESGDIAPWEASDFYGYGYMPKFYVVQPGINSNYGLAYYSNETVYTAGSPYLSQTVTTKPNTTYRFTCEIQVNVETYRVRLISTEDPRLAPLHRNRIETRQQRSFPPGTHTFSALVTATSNRTVIRVEAGSFTFGEVTSSIILDNFDMIELQKSKYYP